MGKHPVVSEIQENLRAQLENVLNPSLLERFISIPHDILELSDTELTERTKIGMVEEKLRIAFWVEQGMAAKGKRNMRMTNVYAGICDIGTYNKVIGNSYKLAYLCSPPMEYSMALEQLLYLGNKRMFEILSSENHKKIIDGRTGEESIIIDPKVADVQRRVWVDVQNYLKGSPIHRTENTNLNRNLNTNENINYEGGKPASEKDINQLRGEVEHLEKLVSHGSFPVVDVGKESDNEREVQEEEGRE